MRHLDAHARTEGNARGRITWYMGWIFPGIEKVDERLPERTTLQRKMKKYLLDGKKFGIAKGHLNI